MIVRVTLVALSVLVALLVSLVFPAAANPVAIIVVAAATLGLTLLKDRRVAIGLVAVTSVALSVIAWAAAQPSYVPLS